MCMYSEKIKVKITVLCFFSQMNVINSKNKEQCGNGDYRRLSSPVPNALLKMLKR